MKFIGSFILTVLMVMSLASCTDSYTPLPHGYFRIGLPEKKYCVFDSTLPYRFNYPEYSKVVADADAPSEPY